MTHGSFLKSLKHMVNVYNTENINDFIVLLNNYAQSSEDEKELFNETFLSLDKLKIILFKKCIDVVSIQKENKTIENGLYECFYELYKHILSKREHKLIKEMYENLSDEVISEFEERNINLLQHKELSEFNKNILKSTVKYSKNPYICLGKMVGYAIHNYYEESRNLNNLIFLLSLPQIKNAAKYIDRGTLLMPFVVSKKKSIEIIKELTSHTDIYKEIKEQNLLFILDRLIAAHHKNKETGLSPNLDYFIRNYEIKNNEKLEILLNKEENKEIKEFFNIISIKNKLENELLRKENLNCKKLKI